MENNTHLCDRDGCVLPKMNLYGKLVFVIGCIILVFSVINGFLGFLEIQGHDLSKDQKYITEVTVKPFLFLVIGVYSVMIGRVIISLSLNVFVFFKDHNENKDASMFTFKGMDFYYVFSLALMLVFAVSVLYEMIFKNDPIVTLFFVVFGFFASFSHFFIFWYYNKWVESQKEETKE